jgi:hypothetical protein
MGTTETHKVTLHKPAKRNLNDDVISTNLGDLVASINTKSLAALGWIVDANGNPAWDKKETLDTPGMKYLFRMHVTISYKGEKAPGHTALAAILRTISTRCSQPKFGSWTLAEVNGDEYIPAQGDDDGGMSKDLLGYGEVELPTDWSEHFAHLFGLGAHIKRIRKALDAGIASDWSNRFHCALVGPPGCGKSDISRTIKDIIGEDAVWELDATATTSAGAIKELSEREILPRVIIVEEIEKADERTMAFLLGVMDLRGEIRKQTARATIQRDTKCFCIATVNDLALFEKLQAGALASRFTNRIHFKRPSRETLAMILEREVVKVGGSLDWVEPTLDYCETHKITDPRRVISICLCGGDDLLDGSYQEMLDETSEMAPVTDHEW